MKNIYYKKIRFHDFLWCYGKKISETVAFEMVISTAGLEIDALVEVQERALTSWASS